MPDEIKIPYGYRQVSGQMQKGDGVLVDGKFVKVRKEYPRTDDDRVFVRRCEVVQATIPETTNAP